VLSQTSIWAQRAICIGIGISTLHHHPHLFSFQNLIRGRCHDGFGAQWKSHWEQRALVWMV
jgi:hypothetical protein